MSMTIPLDEWDRVARLTSGRTPSADGAGSVCLRSDDEGRRWIGSRDDVAWLIMGDSDGHTCGAALPPALIWFAAELARRDGSCELTLVRGDLATVESSAGQATFDLTPGTEPDLASWPEAGARATIDSEHLRHLLVACGRSSIDAGADAGDLVWLASEPGRLAASPHDSGPCVTYRTAAQTDGRRSAAIARRPLLALLSALNQVVDGPEVTIDFPERSGEPVGVRGDAWGALVPSLDLSVRRWAEELEEVLGGLNRPVTQATSEVFHVHCDGRLVRVALHGGPPEVVRLSLVLARGLRLTPELQEHVNRANQTLNTVRLWHTETGDLVAATDVLCVELHTLDMAVDVLADQISGLDVLLPALA